jgi:hypothetical protein
MSRLHAVLLVFASIALSACGSGTGGETTVTAGPTDLWIPHLPAAGGETVTVGLKNLSGGTLGATVTAYGSDGTAYPPGAVLEAVPAQGELRQPLGRYTGAAALVGGWIHVVLTSGFAKVYVDRRAGAVSGEAVLAGAWRGVSVEASLTPFTTAYQVVNHSPGAPVLFVLTEYDAFGAVLGAPKTTLPVAMDGSWLEAPAPGARRVHVERMGGPVAGDLFGVSAREGAATVIETRYTSTTDSGVALAGGDVDLAFGRDLAGNYHDFALLLSNGSDGATSVLVNAIWTSTGVLVLGTPRLLVLGPHSTKLYASTTLDSDGLELGETSFFEPFFGDAGLATSLTRFHVSLTVPVDVDVSFRQHDSVFDSWFRIVPFRKTTNDVCVADVEIQTTTIGGTRNVITVSNPTAAPQDVFVRAFTPGGTEYILPTLTVAGLEILDWSPDGLVFRESPTDTTGPPVPYVTLRLTAVGTVGFDALTARVDVAERILHLRSMVVRDLRFE